ncbi:hypothetical protein V565_079560 [Rhizoctonia solani 123E]|uniref:Uncharacterized protein n=1 Tax=Rhizoctonia solani 123E TaxID=1423351 RepID=A0A074S0N4_9AGAM|nr:hypothetical protein V565_079560 [Rhizoctonia solani 123E]
MLSHTTSQGGGRGRGGRGQSARGGRGQTGRYGRGPGTPHPVLGIQFPPCFRNACKILGYCEFKLIEQEYGSLLQVNNQTWGIAGNHRNISAARSQALGDPRAFLKEFFGRYELRHEREQPRNLVYHYRYWKPVMSEFYRMCWAFDWKKPENDDEPPHPEFVKAREEFRDALTLQFNALYGTEEDNLSSWQNLCSVLNLADVPGELEACRNLVASMHVNIVDLIDTPVTQDPIVHFKDEEHLSVYTRHTGKKFPRDNVHSGDLLRFLLRKIDAYDPEFHDRRHGSTCNQVVSGLSSED